MQGPASQGQWLDFAPSSQRLELLSFSSYPFQGRQGREQPEKKENPTHEVREKTEVQAMAKWDFCLCFTLGKWPAPLCAYLGTKKSFISVLYDSDKDQRAWPSQQSPGPSNLLGRGGCSASGRDKVSIRALPLQTGLRHKLLLHFASCIPGKWKQFFPIALRHKCWIELPESPLSSLSSQQSMACRVSHKAASAAHRHTSPMATDMPRKQGVPLRPSSLYRF